MKEKLIENKPQGVSTIRHYVIGGHPGSAVLDEAGVTQVEYYQGVLESIMNWSNLSAIEVEEAIRESPDTIENSDQPNYKLLYLQALNNIRSSQR